MERKKKNAENERKAKKLREKEEQSAMDEMTIVESMNRTFVYESQMRLEGEEEAHSFNLFLPTLITKFMDFKPISADVFQERMRWRGGNTYKSAEISLDSTLIRSPHDFKKYFNNLIDLRANDEFDYTQSRRGAQLGGLFELDVPNAEYLLKINISADQQVVFQIACFESESAIATFLLQGLTFLFKKP